MVAAGQPTALRPAVDRCVNRPDRAPAALAELNADAHAFTPDSTATQMQTISRDRQCEMIRNAACGWHIQRRADRREIPDHATESPAAKLYRSGLAYLMPRR